MNPTPFEQDHPRRRAPARRSSALSPWLWRSSLALGLVLLGACAPGELGTSQALVDTDSGMRSLERRLQNDPTACLDYLDLCERATSLCLLVPPGHQSQTVCADIKLRCDTNLATYCGHLNPVADGGNTIPADAGHPPAHDQGPPSAPDQGPPPPAPDAGSPPPPPPPPPGKGIWTSAAELSTRPTSGPAWDNVKKRADESWDSPDLYDQDSHHPLQTMAAALVYARTGGTSYRTKTASAIMSIIVTSSQGRSLGLGRNLAAYVIAADLIGLGQLDAIKDVKFRAFLTSVRKWTNDEGRSLIECHDIRPNNWGTMCGASRIAADLYLGDSADLAQAIKVFKGYIGDRSAYAGFKFATDAFSWMCDPQQPRPMNPAGCSKSGHDLSGAPVDDVQRAGSYTWPPNATAYAWGGFSAAAAQAEMLHRAGHAAYTWESQAIYRGMKFLASAMPSSQSSATEWLPWLVNLRYKASFPANTPVGFGRLISFTDWTHGK